MGRDGMGPIGVFQITVAVFAAIAFGIDFLIEGKISKDFIVFIMTIWGGLVLSGFHERLDNIRDNTEGIKIQNEKLEERVNDIEQRLEDVEEKYIT
jgi:flagellar capping protein FliD